MNKPFIFLGDGKVHFVNSAGDVIGLESNYAADLISKSLKAQERHGWKQEEGGSFLSGPRLWGKGGPAEPVAITFTSVAAGKRSDEFVYSLRTDHLCAICSVRGEAAEEQRLWNHQSKKLSHLHVHPTLGHMVCSSEKPNGCAHIVVRTAEDGALSEVTEGDSFDTAPTWAPGEKLRIVFQSAGVGRDKEGHFRGLGAYAIHLLDVESGEMTTLSEHSKFDLITPRLTSDGTLYFIRRPYIGDARAGALDRLKDIFLFPIRMAQAVFGFLNYFSMMYSGRQLKTVKQADAKDMPVPQMLLFGNMLKAQQADADNPNPGLVPKSWELIRRREGGADEKLASGVLCFDVTEDGTIVHSNGKQITMLKRDGSKETMTERAFVQQVAFLR